MLSLIFHFYLMKITSEKLKLKQAVIFLSAFFISVNLDYKSLKCIRNKYWEKFTHCHTFWRRSNLYIEMERFA